MLFNAFSLHDINEVVVNWAACSLFTLSRIVIPLVAIDSYESFYIIKQ